MIKLELVNPRTWKDGDILTIEVLEVIEERSGVWKIKVREVKEAPGGEPCQVIGH